MTFPRVRFHSMRWAARPRAKAPNFDEKSKGVIAYPMIRSKVASATGTSHGRPAYPAAIRTKCHGTKTTCTPPYAPILAMPVFR